MCCPMSIKFGMCGYILVKFPNVKFLENPTMVSARILADRRMDGQTDKTRLLEIVEEGSWRVGTEWRRSGDSIDVEAGW